MMKLPKDTPNVYTQAMVDKWKREEAEKKKKAEEKKETEVKKKTKGK